MIWFVIGLFLLIILSAFFSGSETAFFSLSHIRVHELVESKTKHAGLLQRLKKKPDKLLITILIGNNLANVSASAIAAYICQIYFHEWGISIAIAFTTFFILIFGEITPKSFSIKHAETIALKVSPIIKFFQIIFAPLEVILNFITRIFTGSAPKFDRPVVTEETVKSILDIGEEEGNIKSEETEMIRNVFEMDDIEAKEVLTPRVDMYCLPFENTIGEVIQEIISKGFSRIPVYDGMIDKTVGIVYVKDMMIFLVDRKLNIKLKDIMKPPIIIPENKVISSILELFLQKNVHIAMVVDEHGGIEGLVTIEDIIEELVGEIYDEIDKPERIIHKIDSNTYKILGKASIDDLNSEIGLSLNEDEDYETVSGLVLSKIERIPDEGEEIEFEDIKLKILKVKENRIWELLLSIQKKDDNPDDDSSGN